MKTIRMKNITKLTLVAIALVSLASYLQSCYPYPNRTDYLDEFDAVVTRRNDAVDPTQRTTFAIPDSIYIIVNRPGDDDDYFLEDTDPQFAADIKNAVRNEMQKYGYTEWDSTATAEPDLAFNITGIEITITGVSINPCGWWGWGGCYWCYPGWGFPCYWPSYYQYETGTMFVDMADIVDSDIPNENIVMAWSGSIAGLLSSNSQSNKSRVDRGIQQAFIQSPYLDKNN